ncbi:hypothetical protein AMK09_06525 [Streptomyces sp. CB02488]|uniref:tyrosine-type recombinase/integrase n=1 Tax=Streptomyces sp. CB02488 TaxID=1703920 RepID=UPI0009399CB4|nr:site-specific integrase [Streptomyces sp. CB02488]OKK24453.1 hypothetical protein AMK09_06525 [Streptomyces sp. CB02488]
MTVHALSEALVRDPTNADSAEWAAWLRDNLESNWRPDEWDAEHWMFTGDPANPRTTTAKCPVRACTRLVNSLSTWCETCQREFTKSSLSEADFIVTFVPQPNRRLGQIPEPCRLERDGVRCRRESWSLGLCKAHASTWAQWLSRHPGAELEPWLATTTSRPLPDLITCIVAGCPRQQTQPLALCQMHRNRWRTHSRQRLTGDLDFDSWTKSQLPYIGMQQFSLAPLSEVLRLELLHGLQKRDARGGKIDPQAVRWTVLNLQHLPSLAFVTPQELDTLERRAYSNGLAFLREVRWAVGVAFEKFRGIDPEDKRTWDLVAVGVPSSASISGRRQHAGSVSFNQFSQPWLRDLTWEWARATRPKSGKLGHRLRACRVASQALDQRPGGGMDIAALQFADMAAVADAFRSLLKKDGTAMQSKTRRDLQAAFHEILDFGREEGLLDRMSGSFTRHNSHRIPDEDPNEDEIGKALPEPVISQLDSHLDLLGHDFIYGLLEPEDVKAMFQTAYTVLRDTGRRPWEVGNLSLNCIDSDNGDYTLIWNNHKARRNRRRLPITAATAHAILRWRERRLMLDVPSRSVNYLFPAITDGSGIPHLNSGNLARAIRAWADSIPVIHSEVLDEDSNPLPFDRLLIYPYAFRHSYAQRHADAGVDVDVLRDLMDHRSIQTTLGYFSVSLKRKREAVETMRHHVVDRHGRPAPMGSSTAYEARSVAVPFGNCVEPSNIKAGGKKCPIRFQCAGCGFYRPDPSYLPAVEDHIRSLKADREVALAMDAANFVVNNLDEQVEAFRGVVERMQGTLEWLSPEDREAVEEASKVLRKIRASSGGRTLLPLTVVTHEEPTR